MQNVGDRTVVYLADSKQPGRFIEREVRLGQVSGQQIEVASGVQPGDLVVTQGSFFVRAERERLGLRPPATALPAAPSQTQPATSREEAGDTNRNVTIIVKNRATRRRRSHFVAEAQRA